MKFLLCCVLLLCCVCFVVLIKFSDLAVGSNLVLSNHNLDASSPVSTLFWHCDVVLTLGTLYGHRNDVVCLLGPLGYYSLFTTFKRKNKKNLEKRCFIKISENIFNLNKYTMFLLTVCFWKKKLENVLHKTKMFHECLLHKISFFNSNKLLLMQVLLSLRNSCKSTVLISWCFFDHQVKLIRKHSDPMHIAFSYGWTKPIPFPDQLYN